eukprot:6060983-Pleurochrysis_carterae.AAC.1
MNRSDERLVCLLKIPRPFNPANRAQRPPCRRRGRACSCAEAAAALWRRCSIDAATSVLRRNRGSTFCPVFKVPA